MLAKPLAGQPETDDEREVWPWWKAKKVRFLTSVGTAAEYIVDCGGTAEVEHCRVHMVQCRTINRVLAQYGKTVHYKAPATRRSTGRSPTIILNEDTRGQSQARSEYYTPLAKVSSRRNHSQLECILFIRYCSSSRFWKSRGWVFAFVVSFSVCGGGK